MFEPTAWNNLCPWSNQLSYWPSNAPIENPNSIHCRLCDVSAPYNLFSDMYVCSKVDLKLVTHHFLIILRRRCICMFIVKLITTK